MSRDGLGRAPATPARDGTPAGPPDDARPDAGEPDDVTTPPAASAERPGHVPSAAHAVAALLLLAGIGAAGAGLSPRSGPPAPAADEPGAVRLVVVEARPDPDADPRADVLAVRLAVEGRGGVDVVVLGGGSGEPGRRVPGRVALTGAGWLASRADAPVVVRAGGTTEVVLTVDVGCEPAPALAPWLLVRPPAGALELVELEAADPGARGALEDACAAREVERARLASPLAPGPAPGTPSGGGSGVAGGVRAAP
ncbi:hypothetical protein WDV85_13545 [Pseudokineococcus sp. 5B2Z-1]|uniref:hypothetical protein n=1 Tax=Pseudokineococcus sp. 5B2Z-1 TaxID=3132744 RepID=UPI0030A62E15